MARDRLLTVRASQRAMERLALASQLQGESMSEFVRKAVSERILTAESSIDVPESAMVLAGELALEDSEQCRHELSSCRICQTGRFDNG
jgi:hypothetical protein